MEQLRKNDVREVTIEGYSAEGLGVARVEGRVVFVHGAVRGERCQVRVLKVLKNMAFGRVERVLEPAPARRTAPTTPPAAAATSATSPMRRSCPPSGSGWRTPCAGWAGRTWPWRRSWVARLWTATGTSVSSP